MPVVLRPGKRDILQYRSVLREVAFRVHHQQPPICTAVMAPERIPADSQFGAGIFSIWHHTPGRAAAPGGICSSAADGLTSWRVAPPPAPVPDRLARFPSTRVP